MSTWRPPQHVIANTIPDCNTLSYSVYVTWIWQKQFPTLFWGQNDVLNVTSQSIKFDNVNNSYGQFFDYLLLNILVNIILVKDYFS